MFYSRHSHSARVTISADRGWRLRAPDGLIRKARRPYKRIVPRGVTGSEGQEGANGVGGGIGVGGGNGDGNGDVDGHGDGDGAGAGTGVEVNEEAQDRNGDGAGTRTGTGVGTRSRTPDGNGDGDGDGSEDCSGDVVVVVVVSHIQRIGCQPEKTTLHGGQSRSWSAEQGKENKRKSLAAYPPPPHPHTARSEKINKITRRIYRRYAGGRSRVRTRIPSARRLGLWVWLRKILHSRLR